MKIIQFNWLHPIEFIRNERKKITGIIGQDLKQYSLWLRENGYGMTDTFSLFFQNNDHQVVNYFWSDDKFREKLAAEEKLGRTDLKLIVNYFAGSSFKQTYRYFALKSERIRQSSEMKLIKHICSQQADIIFLREPAGIDHRLLKIIKKAAVVKTVCLQGCEFKHILNFDPVMYDAVFTIANNYFAFFESVKRNTFLFKYGAYKFKGDNSLVNDIVFVGDLAGIGQETKAKLMNEVANSYDFKWWGPCNVNDQIYPALFKTYNGMIAGNKMLDIYSSSKIVLNDYPTEFQGEAVNMRIWDAISAGSFLITRESENLKMLKEKVGLALFKNTEDCLNLINYWLQNDKERMKTALRTKEYCLKNFSFENDMNMVLREMKCLQRIYSYE